MQRRRLTFGAMGAVGAISAIRVIGAIGAISVFSSLALSGNARAQDLAQGQGHGQGVHAALLLPPDGRAVQLRRFTPAAGPLQRHTSRPGAWYALLYLPMAPHWPVQLRLWSTERGHELRLFALDAAPDQAPSVVQALPLDTETSRIGRPPRLSSRFMLPAASTAAALFVLIEQWRIDGEQPAPLWLQFLAYPVPQRASVPWWAPRAPHASGDSDNAVPPPSPLTQQLRDGRAFEVPIFNLPAAPDSGVWR